jgi:phosphoribosylformylglycinamidine cyclo-ligase
MAHITGGGLLENIIRVVPDGLGLALDSSSWRLPPVFDWLQREGNVSQMEMWRTFNCGIGFTLIVARDAAPATIAALGRLGLPARVIGEVIAARDDGRVHVV